MERSLSGMTGCWPAHRLVGAAVVEQCVGVWPSLASGSPLFSASPLTGSRAAQPPG